MWLQNQSFPHILFKPSCSSSLGYINLNLEAMASVLGVCEVVNKYFSCA